jgi:hypothetical protein
VSASFTFIDLDFLKVLVGAVPRFHATTPTTHHITTMVKATKQTKKFVSSGKLKQTIEKRRKYQQVQKKVAGREIRKAAKEKNGKGKHADETDDDEEDEDIIVESDDDAGSKKNKGKG